MRVRPAVIAGVGLFGIMAGGSAVQSASPPSADKPTWDRIANVETAANQIGEIQARQGVEQAFKFISACYKTHGLASNYSKSFEGCIAQDYIVSKTLAQVYSRLPRETLDRMGAPTAEKIDQSFQQRAASAFELYKRTPEDALALRGIVEARGLPVFLNIVFPKSAADVPSPSPQKKQ
jgi:hypothetical protein